jgi:hypothetical protein
MGRSLDAPFEPRLERGVVVGAKPLAQEPYLLFCAEEVWTLLFEQYPTQDPPQEVDVPPQRLVLRLEADPGRQVGVLGPRRRLHRSSADIHGR